MITTFLREAPDYDSTGRKDIYLVIHTDTPRCALVTFFFNGYARSKIVTDGYYEELLSGFPKITKLPIPVTDVDCYTCLDRRYLLPDDPLLETPDDTAPHKGKNSFVKSLNRSEKWFRPKKTPGPG